MKFLGFNISRTPSTPDTRHSSPVTRSLACTPEEWLRGGDIGYGGPLLSNAYQQVVWVYRAINVLAEQVANIPFLFSSGERGRETLITHGPLLDFYARPHPHITRFQYWELRILWLMLRGECFRIPIYDNAPASSPFPRGPRIAERSSLVGPHTGGGLGKPLGRAEGELPVPSASDPASSIRHPASPRRRLSRVLILDPAHFHHIVENHELIGWRYTGFGPRAPLAGQVFLPEEVWFEKLPNPFDFWRGMSPLYVAETAAKTDFAASAFMRGIIENNADTGVIVRTEKPIDPEQQEQLLSYLRDRKRRAGTADRPVVLSGVAEIVKPELSSSDIQFLENRKFSRSEICAAFGVPEEIITSTEHAKYDVMVGARQNFIENRVGPLCSRLEAEEDVTVKSLDGHAVGWFDLDSLPIMQQARRNRLATAQTGFAMGIPFNELNRVLDLGFKPLAWGDKGYAAANLQELGGAGGNSKSQTPGSNPTEAGPSSKNQKGVIEQALGFLAGSCSGAKHARSNPELTGKLRRFMFEQRGRVLGKLSVGEGVFGRVGQNDFFDLAVENEKLIALLQPLGMAEDDLREVNSRMFEALTKSLREGTNLNETREQLAARAREIFNTVSRAPSIIPKG